MTDLLLGIENLKVSLPTERGLLNAVRGIDLQIAQGQTFAPARRRG